MHTSIILHWLGKRFGVAVFVSFWGLLVLMQSPAAATASEVEIHTRAGLKETEYCLQAGECRHCWTTYQTEINQGIYHARSRCRLPLADQVPHLKELIKKIDTREARGPAFHTLFWGGLGKDENQGHSQMSLRLALAAFKSRGWDKIKGRPKKGHANPFVMDLANEAHIYSELQGLFEAFGRKIKVSGIEKVLVKPAGQLSFYDRLKAHGVQSDHRLPYDGLTWFGISSK